MAGFEHARRLASRSVTLRGEMNWRCGWDEREDVLLMVEWTVGIRDMVGV